MSMGIPLGVRVFRPFEEFDRQITQYVDDVQYRSVIPGGFASATIVFRLPEFEFAPDMMTGQATAFDNSATSNYLVCTDGDASDINIGDRGWVYTDSTLSSIRFNGVRLRVIAKNSAFGFTNIVFNQSPGITNTGNVFVVSKPGRLLTANALFSQIPALFNRVQIFDLRNMEIVWEGRIEEPARGTDEPNVWTLNCLGSAVAASDIERPMWYMDRSGKFWGVDNNSDEYTEQSHFDQEIDDSSGTCTLRLKFKDGSTGGSSDNQPQMAQVAVTNPYQFFRWDLARATATYVAKFHVKIKGTDSLNPSGSLADADGALQSGIVFESLNFTQTAMRDQKTWNGTTSEFADTVGDAEMNITDCSSIRAVARARDDGANMRILTTGGHSISCTWWGIEIQVQRKNRFRLGLNATTSYEHGHFVTVPMIVDDVVGRYLNGGWDLILDNAPYPGLVRPQDMYLDMSSAQQIKHLVYEEGATAEKILNDCMVYQPGAYWAIWEGRHPFAFHYGVGEWTGNTYWFSQWRFEWATWPSSWGYFISEYDTFEEQPSGEELANFMFVTYSKRRPFMSSDFLNDGVHISHSENINSRALERGGFTRAKHLIRRDLKPTTSSGDEGDAAANVVADQYRKDHSVATNAGSVTVSRPVFFYDSGRNNHGGGIRSIDPWAIRPGKLVRAGRFISEAGSFDHFSDADNVIVDYFDRTVADEWSQTSSGADYNLSGGASTDYDVAGGIGTVTHPDTGVARNPNVASPSPDVDIWLDVNVSAIALGSSLFCGPTARYIDNNNFYQAELDFQVGGGLTIRLWKRVAAISTALSSAFTISGGYVNGQWFRLRFRAVGREFQAKIWSISSTNIEPQWWQVTGVDSSMAQTARTGIRCYRNTGNTNANAQFRFDNFQIINRGYPRNAEGALWKGVTTDYDSSDNTCKIGLDRLETWSLPGQVVQ